MYDACFFDVAIWTKQCSTATCSEKVKRSLCGWFEPQYRNDAVMALMIFWTIGGQNMMSNFLEHFILGVQRGDEPTQQPLTTLPL